MILQSLIFNDEKIQEIELYRMVLKQAELYSFGIASYFMNSQSATLSNTSKFNAVASASHSITSLRIRKYNGFVKLLFIIFLFLILYIMWYIRKFLIDFQIPLGVILAIPPFNYPVNLAVSKIAPALIAGNSLVLKPPTQVDKYKLVMIHESILVMESYFSFPFSFSGFCF